MVGGRAFEPIKGSSSGLIAAEGRSERGWKVETDMVFCFCSFTGIGPSQSQALVEKAHVYLTANGRISMAGLNSHNVRYFATQLDKAVRGTL